MKDGVGVHGAPGHGDGRVASPGPRRRRDGPAVNVPQQQHGDLTPHPAEKTLLLL